MGTPDTSCILHTIRQSVPKILPHTLHCLMFRLALHSTLTDWRRTPARRDASRQRRSNINACSSIRPITTHRVFGTQRRAPKVRVRCRAASAGVIDRPALGMVSRGNAPDPIWLVQAITATLKSRANRRGYRALETLRLARISASARARWRNVGSLSARRSGSR